MKRRDIIIGGRAVRYYELGEGPPVVLVHGAGATARLWRRIMSALAGSSHAIAPDLPGFGGSEFYPGAAGRDGMARFIGGFMDTLGIGKAPVVASSMGGRAACILAAGRPEAVSSLVLISPSGLSIKDEPSISIDDLLDEVARGYGEYLHMGERAAEEKEKALSTIRALYEGGGLATDIEGELGRIAAPTLIVWGENDGVIPVSYAGLFKEAIPGSRVSIINGAGHLPYAEKPEETSAVITSFLAAH